MPPVSVAHLKCVTTLVEATSSYFFISLKYCLIARIGCWWHSYKCYIHFCGTQRPCLQAGGTRSTCWHLQHRSCAASVPAARCSQVSSLEGSLLRELTPDCTSRTSSGLPRLTPFVFLLINTIVPQLDHSCCWQGVVCL